MVEISDKEKCFYMIERRNTFCVKDRKTLLIYNGK